MNYILYTERDKKEFGSFEEAKKVYGKTTDPKFLYQPDKRYYMGTLSSTGSVIGDDHLYHRNVAKCTGLFMANSQAEIKRFLRNAKWKHRSSAGEATIARLYGNGGYGSLYCSDTDWDDFDRSVKDYLYNIVYFSNLNVGFGAVDVNNENQQTECPYKLC